MGRPRLRRPQPPSRGAGKCNAARFAVLVPPTARFDRQFTPVVRGLPLPSPLKGAILA